jgi:hypothetical protein
MTSKVLNPAALALALSVTIGDHSTQFLVADPINCYLKNSPTPPDLKKTPDGSRMFDA